jgi:dynein heavy chain
VIKDVDYGGLQRSIEEQLESLHQSKTPKFLTKIIQLMETIMVRHGVMVVGLTGTGKTTVIHTLARAVEQLYREGSTDYYHKPVQK